MTSNAKPHSPEWFTEVEQIDPLQATQTRQVIKLAGRSDVCSVCGDHPALTFRIVVPTPAPGHPGTIRLCNDCLGLRGAVGEKFGRIS